MVVYKRAIILPGQVGYVHISIEGQLCTRAYVRAYLIEFIQNIVQWDCTLVIDIDRSNG